MHRPGTVTSDSAIQARPPFCRTVHVPALVGRSIHGRHSFRRVTDDDPETPVQAAVARPTDTRREAVRLIRRLSARVDILELLSDFGAPAVTMTNTRTETQAANEAVLPEFLKPREATDILRLSIHGLTERLPREGRTSTGFLTQGLGGAPGLEKLRFQFAYGPKKWKRISIKE